MSSQATSSKALTLFNKRYPSLAFLRSLQEEQDDTALPEETLTLPLLEGVELTYLLGVELALNFELFESWLEENSNRHLVILEPQLARLTPFLQTAQAEGVLQHRRVHIRVPLEPARLSQCLIECAEAFPLEHITWITSSYYQQYFSESLIEYEELLYSHTTQQHALFQERFYAHIFFRNSLLNLKREGAAFLANRLKGAFKGVPVIICGAGPSLAKDLERLKTLYDRALIISAGSAIAALSCAGVPFHMAMAIDPNEEEVSRFKENVAFETTLVYVSRLHHDVFNTLNGSCGVLHTPNGGKALQTLKEALGATGEALAQGFGLDAMSVTTTALELAVTMGCGPIILTGVDLAYTGGARYLPGVIEDSGFTQEAQAADKRCSEKLNKVKDIHGKPICTLSKWQMESEAIARFIQAHPEIAFFNASMEGIGMEGVENRPLTNIEFPHYYDIEGRLDTYRAPLIGEKSHQIEPLLQTWVEGLKEAHALCKQALEHLAKGEEKGEEDGKLIYLTIAFKDLEVSPLFFEESEPAIELMCRLGMPDEGLIPCKADKLHLQTRALHTLWETREGVARYLIESF